ncbi:MAG: NAD(P)-dependent dehydrogenase (short-subunit alcohol dehydrogenase family) [Parvicella sp.]|jgi:NAD(P)-dependent dehydrogenase (short-subunit alcohol dehydrogenase family)
MGNYAMTGGATGIGAAIKKSLIDDGHQVLVVDIKQADIEADLSSAEGRAGAISALQSQCADGLDGFIACAGVASQAPPALTTSLNFYGTVELVDGVFDLLAKNNGNVILVSSNSAPMSSDTDYVDSLLDQDEAAALKLAENIEGHQAYSGTKQAVARWMRRNINRFTAQGIRINAIAPGYTQTPMTAAVENDPVYGPKIKAFLDSIPMGRPGKPEDMAKATKFLLSEDSSFICGAVLFIDGGHDAMLRPDHF